MKPQLLMIGDCLQTSFASFRYECLTGSGISAYFFCQSPSALLMAESRASGSIPLIEVPILSGFMLGPRNDGKSYSTPHFPNLGLSILPNHKNPETLNFPVPAPR